MPRGRKPGTPKTGGRKKGSVNHVTTDVREAIKRAFDKLGGERWLADLGLADPKAFSVLLAKIVPNTVEAKVSILEEMTLDDRRAVVAALEALRAGEDEAGSGVSALH